MFSGVVVVAFGLSTNVIRGHNPQIVKADRHGDDETLTQIDNLLIDVCNSQMYHLFLSSSDVHPLHYGRA